MGLFNTLEASSTCPACGKAGLFRVQFKYGFTRQTSYRLGEPLKWSNTRNDIGAPGAGKVLVEAISEAPCPNCGEESLEFDIVVESDRLMALNPVGKSRTNSTPEGFVVVK